MRAHTLSLAILLAAAACSKPAPAADDRPAPTAATGATAPPTAGAAPQAKAIFEQRCTPCHGIGGAGDGVASASLTPKPRNFTDATWQTSVEDAYLEKIIKYGGAAVGKSPSMPGNPDLNDPAVLTALKDVVRSLKK